MLKNSLKVLLAASIALPAAVFTEAAQAGPRHHRDRHHNYNYGGGYYVYTPPPPAYYAPRPRGYYYGGYYGHRHGRAGTYLGVALLGLGVGYLLSKSNDVNQQNYQNQPPPPAYNQQQGYSAPPPAQQNYQPGAQAFDFSQCEDTREYVTTIIVDGREQDAHGTACLRADGTWVAGPMRIGN